MQKGNFINFKSNKSDDFDNLKVSSDEITTYKWLDPYEALINYFDSFAPPQITILNILTSFYDRNKISEFLENQRELKIPLLLMKKFDKKKNLNVIFPWDKEYFFEKILEVDNHKYIKYILNSCYNSQYKNKGNFRFDYQKNFTIDKFNSIPKPFNFIRNLEEIEKDYNLKIPKF